MLMKKLRLIFILLTLNSICSLGQSTNEEVINLTTQSFCKCASMAKDKQEFELCGEKMKTLDSLQLSNSEAKYLFERLNNICGELLAKLWGDDSRDGIEIPNCSFLNEDDLKEYNLQKSTLDQSSLEWTGNAKRQKIKSLVDHRTSFSSDTNAITSLEEQMKLALSESEKTIKILDDTFQTVDAYRLGQIDNSTVYLVYARKDNVIYRLTIDIIPDDVLTPYKTG
jgi:hypothetical protein